MKKLLSAPVLFAAAGILLVVGVVLAFWYSPIDSSSMGFSQKILYYHAPIAASGLVAYGVAFVAAIMYLRTQDLKWDRLSYVSVRIGLLFSVLVMATGMIWGKAAWGVWWAWEPRLTTFLLACFLWLIQRCWRCAWRVFHDAVVDLDRFVGLGALTAIVGLLIHSLGANTFIIVRIMEPFWFIMALIARLYVLEPEPADRPELAAATAA